MKFIRKALLPAVIAATLLGFMGAVGTSADVVNPDADPGDVCAIIGPSLISEGETADYTAHIEGGVLTLADILDGIGGDIIGIELAEATADVNLDDQGGDSDITSYDSDGDGDTEAIPATDHLNAEAFELGENVCGETDEDAIDALADDIYDYLIDGVELGEICAVDSIETDNDGDATDCQTPAPGDAGPGDAQYSNGFNDLDIDCGYTGFTADNCVISSAALRAVAEAMAADVINGDELSICGTDETAEEAALDANTTEFVAFQIQDYVQDTCFDLGIVGALDDLYIMVDVTCDDAGIFDLSFAPEFELRIDLAVGADVFVTYDAGLALSHEVRCGSDVDHGTITALPTTVETNPSIANVAHSLVWVVLFDEDDDNALAGDEVMFTSDRCAIESSTVDTEEEFEAAELLFRTNNALVPSTAAAVESSVYATTGPDGASRQQEEVNSFVVTGSAATNFAERTVAAVILHCDPVHAPGVTPGPAVVTAWIERGDDDQDEGDLDDDLSNNDDLVLKTTVTVVGPPAANGVTLTAAPATLACGEKATLTATIKDSIGQPVSDHTFVEAVTNAGGVLAGTGAVAGQAGLVSPVSSTVMETYGGVATFYLLTSTAHVGAYEVVVTTGGGGGVTGQLVNGGVSTNLLGGLFTTQPISVQVTVTCTVPTPVNVQVNVPDTTGPRTGQGITPPSTGDAGLASTESNWVVGAVAAVVASLVIAGFSVKLVRDEN